MNVDAGEIVNNLETTEMLNKMVDGSSNVESNDLGSIRSQVKENSEKIESLREVVFSKETSVTKSMEELFNTVKIVSHNQTVLENKLDDLLNNQMNTDVIVNKFRDFLDKLNAQVKNSSANDSYNNHSNSILFSSLINGHSPSPSSSSNAQLVSSFHNELRRGPGRPRKDDTPVINDLLSTIPSSLKKILPSSNVSISKSKKYFVDPLKQHEYESNNNGRTGNVGRPPKSKKSAAVLQDNLNSKRRGRPPKKRTVDSVLVKVDYTSDDKNSQDKVTKELEENDSEMNTEDESEEIEDSNNTDKNYTTSLLLDSSSKPSTRSNSKLKLVKDTKNIKEEDDLLTMNNLTTKQEKELDKRRDEREKMLVNLKYNDRDRAKSFMESNKKLLKAMKEEERRKKLNPLHGSESPKLNELSKNDELSMEEGEYHLDEDTSDQNDSTKLSTISQVIEATSSPKFTSANPPIKVGISSILNDATITDDTHSVGHEEIIDGSSQSKRGLPEEFDQEGGVLNDNLITGLRQLRKRRATNDKEDSGTPSIIGDDEKSILLGKSGELNDKNSDAAVHEKTFTILTDHPIELFCKGGLFYLRNSLDNPVTIGDYLQYKYQEKEDDLVTTNKRGIDNLELGKNDRMNSHIFKPAIAAETKDAFEILGSTILTEKYINSLEYFLMEFHWENKLVSLGLKLKESKRTWQRRKALFALFEFWRDQSREKRNFKDYTIMHSVKEMESYRIFINRSVSWFYNHITLLKMILYDLCDNVESQWREWMFPKDQKLPTLGVDGVDHSNINSAIDGILTLDFLQHENDDALTLEKSDKESALIKNEITASGRILSASTLETTEEPEIPELPEVSVEPEIHEVPQVHHIQQVQETPEVKSFTPDDKIVSSTSPYVTNIEVANGEDEDDNNGIHEINGINGHNETNETNETNDINEN